MQYLYTDGDLFHFMDTSTYDQIALSPAAVGEATKYIKEGMTLDLNVASDEAIGIELPPNVEAAGDRIRAGTPRRHGEWGHETGDAGDGGGGASAALHWAGRTDPRRHADR